MSYIFSLLVIIVVFNLKYVNLFPYNITTENLDVKQEIELNEQINLYGNYYKKLFVSRKCFRISFTYVVFHVLLITELFVKNRANIETGLIQDVLVLALGLIKPFSLCLNIKTLASSRISKNKSRKHLCRPCSMPSTYQMLALNGNPSERRT